MKTTRPATAAGDPGPLTRPQRAAIERLAAGDSATAAAAAARVGRTTVYRWLQHDPAFRAAYHAWQAEAAASARARLLALADAAVTTVAAAVANGDTRLALAVLKGQGLLTPPTPGPTDPALIARQDRHRRARAEEAMVNAELTCPAEIFAPDPPPAALDDDPPDPALSYTPTELAGLRQLGWTDAELAE